MGRLEHRYGDNVHILTDPWSRTCLMRLSSPESSGLMFHRLLDSAFRRILVAATEHLPRLTYDVATRMAPTEPRAILREEYLDPDQRVVVVDVARGGMIPSHIFQLQLLELLPDDAIRVDHIYMQRVTDDSGHVAGVETSGSKIGGSVDGAVVIIPDPMAATGASMAEVIDLYASRLEGTPAKIIVCHLIVTPEYLRKIQSLPHDVTICAMRVDRGLSDPEVLDTVPGTHWERERGLDDHDYIVPGAGGLGELINNAFV